MNAKRQTDLLRGRLPFRVFVADLSDQFDHQERGQKTEHRPDGGIARVVQAEIDARQGDAEPDGQQQGEHARHRDHPRRQQRESGGRVAGRKRRILKRPPARSRLRKNLVRPKARHAPFRQNDRKMAQRHGRQRLPADDSPRVRHHKSDQRGKAEAERRPADERKDRKQQIARSAVPSNIHMKEQGTFPLMESVVKSHHHSVPPVFPGTGLREPRKTESGSQRYCHFNR